MVFLVMGILLIGVCVLLFYISARNRFRQYAVSIEESKQNVDIALVKRYDTISKMLKVAKSYAKHESELLGNLVQQRQSGSIDDMNRAMANQGDVLRSIYAVGESYPQMLSSQQFLKLQDQIAKENDQLAAAKRIVNSNVREYNQLVVTWPYSMMATGGQKPFLVEGDVAEKSDISGFDYDV